MSLELLLKPAIDAGQATLDAGGNNTDALQEFVKHLDVKGLGTWWPVRSADFDASVWGDWEAWEFCVFGELEGGAVGARPTGEWIAWNAKTGQNIVFSNNENRRRAAEMLSVLKNEGRPTRVVMRDGSFSESTFRYSEISQQVEERLAPAEASSN